MTENRLPQPSDSGKHDRWRDASLEQVGRVIDALCEEAARMVAEDPDLRRRLRAAQADDRAKRAFPGKLRRGS